MNANVENLKQALAALSLEDLGELTLDEIDALQRDLAVHSNFVFVALMRRQDSIVFGEEEYRRG